MTAITNYIGAALFYAGSYAAFRTWKWALHPEPAPEPPTAEPELLVIPWSEVAAPNVFRPRRPAPQPQRCPVLRQTRQARMSALSTRCEWALTKMEGRMQTAWRERLSVRRQRELKARWLVLRARVEKLQDLRWTT